MQSYDKPKVVEAFKTKKIISVACGSRHTVAIIQGGLVSTWGDAENGVSGNGEVSGMQFLPQILDSMEDKVITQISTCKCLLSILMIMMIMLLLGGFHTALLTDDGTVWTFGEGKFGRLGHDSTSNASRPTQVVSLQKVVSVACGGFHTAAITTEGALYTWGGGEHGQLGHGELGNKLVPAKVQAMCENKFVAVTCGWSHTVGLTGTIRY